jgi:quercetin dioxygenase-like cupin family protein
MKKKKLKTSPGKGPSRKTSATKAKKTKAMKTEAKKKKKKTKKTSRPAIKIALKGTILKGTPLRAELRHVSWSSVEVEALNPLLGRHFVVGQNVMLARVLLKKGCIVPEHSHHNEQISYVVEGALRFGIDGKEIVVSEGDVLIIPSNMPHSAEALEDTVSLDIFNPPRADWINKTDAYLR